MSVPEATIWALPLSGGWQPIGTDQGVEVIPESVEWDNDEFGGPLTAKFSVRRHTRTPYSDLGPFTPILINDGGVDAWAGRVARTPKQRGDSSIWDVELDGWQAHLDDDLTNMWFVHRYGGRWQNLDTVFEANNGFARGIDVTVGENALISFSVATGTAPPSGSMGSVFLDAGAGRVIERFVCEYDGGGVANMTLNAVSTTDLAAADETVTIDATPIATSPTTVAATFTAPRRYMRLNCLADGGAITGGATAWVKILDIQVYTSTAYESGNASALVSSDVVGAVLAETCPLVSGDQSQIAAGTTTIDHYHPEGYGNARKYIQSVLGYDGAQFALLPAATPLPRLRAIPTRATWIFDAATDAGAMEDAGANDASEIYNQALVTYSDGTGVEVADLNTTESASIAFTNGTFDVNATGWTAGGGTIARDTAPVYAGAGSLALTCVIGAVSCYTEAFSATLKSGRTYTIRFKHRFTQSTELIVVTASQAGGTEIYAREEFTPDGASSFPNSTWMERAITFVATSSTLRFDVQFYNMPLYSAGEVGHIDECTIELAGTTVIDRRGFARTMELAGDVSSSTAATALADNFLDRAQHPPFKAGITLTGHARKMDTDEYVPVGLLPAGDVLIVADDVDLSTGATGRSGVITRTSHTKDSLTTRIELDSREDIITRLVQGQAA